MLNSLLERIRSQGREPTTEDERLIPLAAATLLIEVAWADHDIAKEETAVIRLALAQQFALTEHEIDEVMSSSIAQHGESVGLYAFTRTLVEAWEEPARFDLVVKLWQLALSDDKLDRFEEHMIRKIAELLYVSHQRFIEAKQLARRS
jgi:uncharacterized tellurite resistance protein B-like protein